MRTVARLVAVATLSLWTAAATLGQSQESQLPRFRSGVDIVTLDVTVLDRDRKPIRGLTAADFTIHEDGNPREIVAFDEVIVPDPEEPPAPWVRDVAPDVRTNDIEPQGRILVIVMDDAMLPPTQEFVQHARWAARRVVEMMGPSDMAAVAFTLNNKHAQDFTADRERLLAAIDKFTYGFAFDGRDHDLEQNYSIRTVRSAVEYLGAIPQRRKGVVYVSTGVYFSTFEPTQMVPPGGLGGSASGSQDRIIVGSGLGPQRVLDPRNRQIQEYMRQTFALAQRFNVNVYPVDPGGLGGLENFLKLRSLGFDPTYFREYLLEVAENTGGFAIVNDNEPAEQVGRILVETGAYYLLGYRTEPRQDGRLRRLQVKVHRPGATVRTRNFHHDARPDPPSNADDSPQLPLLTAMSGFLPKGDVPLQVTAAPFAIPGKKESAVAIVARVKQPAVATRTVQKVELLTRAFDPQGKPKGAWQQSARVVLLPTEAAVAEYEVLSRVDVKPGRYQLRIAAHNPGLEKSGSVYYDLEIPNFSNEGVWLSGVVLSSKFGLPVAPRDALSAVLPVVPTTVREFRHDDAVTAFLRIYQRPKKAEAVAITARVLDVQGAIVHEVTDRVSPELFAGNGAAEYRLQLPLERLEPGPCLLTIEARAGERVVRRDLRFTRK